MRFFLFSLAAMAAFLLIVIAGTGCSDNNSLAQPAPVEFGISFYDPAYPATGQPTCDEFGNWHSSPKNLAFTLHRVAGTGGIPACDFEIRKGIPDPASGGELMNRVAYIEYGQNPEHNFDEGNYWVGAYNAGTDRLINFTWLIVREQE